MMINTGILLMMIVALMQSIIGAIVKLVSPNITISLLLLVYYSIPLLFFTYFIYKDGTTLYKSKFIWLHFVRGLCTTMSVLCFFFASVHLGLATSAVLFNTVPIFIPIFAVFILKERISKYIIAGTIISLFGIIIIINPSFGSFFNSFAVIGLSSGIFMAISQVLLKLLTNKEESSNKILFYLYFMCSLISIVFITLETFITKKNPIVIYNYTHTLNLLLTLLCLGLISLTAQYILTKAFYYMEAIKLAPFLYLSIPISSLIGWVFWLQKITINFIVGTFFVIIGIFIIIYIQTKQKQLSR